MPARQSIRLDRSKVFAGASVAITALISVGLAGHLTNGFDHRATNRNLVVATDNPRTAECHGDRAPKDACLYGNEPVSVGLWGDSHANSIATPLASELNKKSVSLRQFTEGGCVPSLGLYATDLNGSCPEFNREVLKYLVEGNREEVVVLVGRYPLRLAGSRFDNKEGGVEFGKVGFHIPDDENLEFINNPKRISMVGKHYRAPIEQLLHSGKKVALVYPIPEVGWHVPNRINRQEMFVQEREPVSTDYPVFQGRTRDARDQLDKLGDHPNLIRIYPEQLFCNTEIANRCIAELDGMPLYFDDDHLSNEYGAPMLAEEIVRAMDSAGWLPASNGESAAGDAVITQQ